MKTCRAPDERRLSNRAPYARRLSDRAPDERRVPDRVPDERRVPDRALCIDGYKGYAGLRRTGKEYLLCDQGAAHQAGLQRQQQVVVLSFERAQPYAGHRLRCRRDGEGP